MPFENSLFSINVPIPFVHLSVGETKSFGEAFQLGLRKIYLRGTPIFSLPHKFKDLLAASSKARRTVGWLSYLILSFFHPKSCSAPKISDFLFILRRDARSFLDRWRCVILATCFMYASFLIRNLPPNWNLILCLLIFASCSFRGLKQFLRVHLFWCLVRLFALLLWHLRYSFNYIYKIILST